MLLDALFYDAVWNRKNAIHKRGESLVLRCFCGVFHYLHDMSSQSHRSGYLGWFYNSFEDAG